MMDPITLKNNLRQFTSDSNVLNDLMGIVAAYCKDSYNEGYSDGYGQGKDDGYDYAYHQGYADGNDSGFACGYEQGLNHDAG